MEAKNGVVTTAKWQNMNWPEIWVLGFKDLMRDNVAYKAIHFIVDPETATDEVLAQFDNVFTDVELDAWINSSDVVPELLITVDVSQDKDNQAITRTATALCFSCIDMQRNTMSLKVMVRYFDNGAEQSNRKQVKEIQVTGAFYGSCIMQLQNRISIAEVIKGIIKRKDSEGAI